MASFYLRFANYIFLQSVKRVIQVKYLLHGYLLSGAAMYVTLWLNTAAAVQMFFIERIFVFFMTLFLKRMRIILRASKTQCHSRLGKPTLKILFIYRKNI